MTFEENNYKKNWYIKSRKLFVQKKYKEYIKEAEQYLEKYPNDVFIRFMYAKSLRNENRLEEAVKNLEINLEIDPNDNHSIIELYYLYYFLKRYEEAYQMIPMVRKTEFNKKSVSIMRLVMRKELGYPCTLFEEEKDNYVKKQIIEYNEKLAYDHILEHTQTDETEENIKEKGIFNDIDLKYLIEVTKENILNSKKANIEEIMDVYFFGVSNIGCGNQETYNYIKVVVVPNTTNIISIYPTNVISEKDAKPLNCDYDKLFKRDNKVKTISRIDKFKEKYNMK